MIDKLSPSIINIISEQHSELQSSPRLTADSVYGCSYLWPMSCRTAQRVVIHYVINLQTFTVLYTVINYKIREEDEQTLSIIII